MVCIPNCVQGVHFTKMLFFLLMSIPILLVLAPFPSSRLSKPTIPTLRKKEKERRRGRERGNPNPPPLGDDEDDESKKVKMEKKNLLSSLMGRKSTHIKISHTPTMTF